MNLSLSELTLPIRLTPASTISDEDLLRFSAQNDSLRIEREANGNLLIMSPTGSRSGKINFRLSRLLDEWTEADGRGYGFDSGTGFKLPNGAVRSADACWVAKERWDGLSEKEQDGYSPLCPEFVVELASATDRLADIQRKIVEEWMPNGVEVAWLIDPKARTVTIYRAEDEPETLYDPSSMQGSGPVRGLELVMARIWQ
jgi:Uma2 family endonuclease